MTTRSPIRTAVCDVLGCDYPIMLAGMGGVARSDLVAAVTAAGGYGLLGIVREPPDLIRREIAAVRARVGIPVVVMVRPRGGDGLWRLAFEKLRRRLEGEGLLAPERKRALPAHPSTIGVVTSAAGAALHDILHVVRRRAPWTRVILAPARVQGEGAGADVARALAALDRSGQVDIIIAGRGGGSIEDLWAFNEEVVARAIAACSVPVISAVGHEIDVTIADLVADYRAPTPSAAAERAVPDHASLARETDTLRTRMDRALQWRLDAARRSVDGAADALEQGVRDVIELRRERAHRCAEMLDALSPLAALRRGYAVPLGTDGRILRSVDEFAPGSAFALRVADGMVDCNAADVRTIELPRATSPEAENG